MRANDRRVDWEVRLIESCARRLYRLRLIISCLRNSSDPRQNAPPPHETQACIPMYEFESVECQFPSRLNEQPELLYVSIVRYVKDDSSRDRDDGRINTENFVCTLDA